MSDYSYGCVHMSGNKYLKVQVGVKCLALNVWRTNVLKFKWASNVWQQISENSHWCQMSLDIKFHVPISHQMSLMSIVTALNWRLRGPVSKVLATNVLAVKQLESTSPSLELSKTFLVEICLIKIKLDLVSTKSNSSSADDENSHIPALSTSTLSSNFHSCDALPWKQFESNIPVAF